MVDGSDHIAWWLVFAAVHRDVVVRAKRFVDDVRAGRAGAADDKRVHRANSVARVASSRRSILPTGVNGSLSTATTSSGVL